ncbi:hypothetical protein DRQ50_11960 [bacterium]|nr:MAG: hypothetical protein DRQ50_11960 [bacterium]
MKKLMKGNGLIPALLLSTVLAGCGASEEAPGEVREVPRNVRVLELGTTSVTEYFEIAGPVTPVRAADLAAEESGPVVALDAVKGSAVKAGQTIVEQERAILAAQLAASRAALANQEYNVDKVRQLHEAGKVSRIELLSAESAYAQARALADVGRVRYARAAIKAPFDGVLVERWVELGEMVAPGQRVARVIDPYTLKIEAFLTDSQVSWIRIGDVATIVLGESDEPASAKVTFVSPEADRMTGKFAVELEIANDALHFRSGVIARARLPKLQSAGVVAVPRDAVIAGRAGPTAYVIQDGRAHLRQLTLGASQGLMVVVRDGVEAGERLVVRGHRDLRDGSLVSVTETSTAADGSLPGDPAAVTTTGSEKRVGGRTAVHEAEAGE